MRSTCDAATIVTALGPTPARSRHLDHAGVRLWILTSLLQKVGGIADPGVWITWAPGAAGIRMVVSVKDVLLRKGGIRLCDVLDGFG